MKVLQLCHRVPFPANDGGNIAMLSLSDSLISQQVELKMLTLNTNKHLVDLKTMNDDVLKKYNLEAVPIDTSVRASQAFINIFSSESYNIKRFYSTTFEAKLIEVLRSFAADVILMESLYMTPYIPAIRKYSSAKIVLRAHNVEYIIWKRLADNEKNIAKRIYLSMLAGRLRKYETQVINKIDAIIPITVDDKELFQKIGSKAAMYVAPVGIDAGNYPGQINSENDLCLFHLGAMDWRPNLEGIEWFLDNCWRQINEKFPALKLFLAGRGFPDKLLKRTDTNVKFSGEVMNAQDFMRDKQILIVPLKSGGGMRVKIIQGMALGKTIISTTIGAEGIDYTNGKNILIADTPEEFLKQTEKCLKDKTLCLTIGKEARELALARYSNSIIGKGVLEFLKSI